MVTEKIILTAIICGTLIVLSIVGTISNHLKRKSGKDGTENGN